MLYTEQDQEKTDPNQYTGGSTKMVRACAESARKQYGLNGF